MDKFDGLNREMVEHFAPRPGRRPLLPPMSEKAQVALMCRMLAREGWNEHIAGHITYRLPNGNILTNPWELAWDELTASDIMTLEWRCKRAYEVELLGGCVPLSDEEVEKVAITDPNGFPFCWEAMARRELRADPGILD